MFRPSPERSTLAALEKVEGAARAAQAAEETAKRANF